MDFSTGQKDVCPVCFLLSRMTQPDALAASALALGCVSAVIAESEIERGELFASACRPHQDQLTQYTYGFAQVAGVDYRAVFAQLGARPAAPAEGTLIHLVLEGRHTVCGRDTEQKWPDSERFVYREKLAIVNCPACRKQQTS